MKVLVITTDKPVNTDTYSKLLKCEGTITLTTYWEFENVVKNEVYDLVILEDNPFIDWLPIQNIIKKLLAKGYSPQEILIVIPSDFLLEV